MSIQKMNCNQIWKPRLDKNIGKNLGLTKLNQSKTSKILTIIDFKARNKFSFVLSLNKTGAEAG